jgi:hypothetical protein
MVTNDSSRMPPPLHYSVDALLVHERVLPAQPEIARARALARAREALRTTDVATISQRVSPSHVRRYLVAAAAGIALVAGAAAAYQMVRRPLSLLPTGERAPGVRQEPPSAPPSVEPTAAPNPAQEIAPVAITPAVRVAPAKAAFPARRTSLTDRTDGRLPELALLTRARQSDARGDYTSVLSVAAEHLRNYPTGRLSEEREVLRVKALVGLGRGSEARYIAAQFRHQFPRSVLLQKVDDMLASLP